MKVGYILGALNAGGSETLMLDLCKNSKITPFDTIVIYRKEGVLIKDFQSSEIKMLHIPINIGLLFFFQILQLRKTLKREKIEIIHTHQSIDTIYAHLASLGLKVKKVQTLHGFDYPSNFFQRLIIRISLCITKKNLFVSESLKKYYSNKYRLKKQNKNVTNYNGIDFNKIELSKTGKFRAELKIDQKKLLIGMVGNFNNVRDQITICKFINILKKEGGIDFLFVFIGGKDSKNPKYYDECKTFCEQEGLDDNVRFLGARIDVPMLLPELDAFIYSSDHDTFGIAVVEAMSAGIPVFVNDWDVMNEITENGARAFIYKTKDENDLLSKFLIYISNKGSYQEQIMLNTQWVRGRYSIQNYIKTLTVIYQSILSNKNE